MILTNGCQRLSWLKGISDWHKIDADARGQLLASDYSIPPALWSDEIVVWSSDRLSFDEGGLTGIIWGVQLNSSDLQNVFRKPDSVSPSDPSRVGRPPEFNWEAMYLEIIALADLDGLPEKQADLERKMAAWFQSRWGKEPSTAQLRKKIAPVYRHKKLARSS